MQKLSALLPALIATSLNAVLCYAINRFPVEEQFANQLHPLIVVLTIVSVIGIAFFTNPSSTPQENTETTNRAWVIGFLPLIRSAVLFGLLKTNQLPPDLTRYADIASLILFVLGTLLPAVLILLPAWLFTGTLRTSKQPGGYIVIPLALSLRVINPLFKKRWESVTRAIIGPQTI